jgi:CheY-like chemotaxis protein
MTKVLVADSAELFLALQGSFLKRSSCEVLAAGTSEEAVEKALAALPDLIVLDADLPGFDALSCCSRLKEEADLRHTPVVIVAAAIDLEACERSGAEALLTKPLAEELFLDAICELAPISYRGSARVAASLEVEYRRQGKSGIGRTKDISLDGLFLKESEPLEEGDLLSMAFDLPVEGGGMIALGGEVVRSLRPDPDSHLIPGAGIRFRGVDQPERIKIARFLQVAAGGEP